MHMNGDSQAGESHQPLKVKTRTSSNFKLFHQTKEANQPWTRVEEMYKANDGKTELNSWCDTPAKSLNAE
jgi:hypothetical protein